MIDKFYAASSASATILAPNFDLAVRHASVLVCHVAVPPRQEKR
jgi:hypothetical protein